MTMNDEPLDVARLAAELRADSADLDVYANVLASTLAEALPEGAVEVERERSLRDRLSGDPGEVTSIKVNAGDTVLELRPGSRGEVTARAVTIVRGVVISRRDISVAEWSQLLAEELAERARESATARSALAQLLGL